MEIKIKKENFLKPALIAEKLTGKSLNLPILNSFLITTQKGKIKFTATNLDIGFEIFAPAKIEKEGQVAVSAKHINSIIFNSKEDNITLKKEDLNLKIITNNSIATLKTNNLEDFPILPKFKKENSFKINTEDFLNGLKSVFFSASMSYFKPEIASVYLYILRNQIFFVTTDSFRLTEKIIEFKEIEEAENNISLLLPIKSAAEIIRILEDISKQEKQLDLNFNKNEFLITNETFSFFSRLTEGVFPDYKQFVPKNFIGEIIINTELFLDILKSSNVFLSRLNDITFEIYPKSGIIEFTTLNPDLGNYYSKTNILKRGFDNFNNERIKITFNLKYLTEGMSRIKSDKTVIKISEEGKPAIIQGEDDKSFIYLIMPMKI